MMKRMAAGAVLGLFYGACCTLLGASVMGDTRGEELAHDALVGLGIVGSALAVKWALEELDVDTEPLKAALSTV